jgi:hypothetical protein
MIFIGRTGKYTWQGYKTNEDILSQLAINPVKGKVIPLQA